MDIAQVRAFLAVAEDLHFGRAAERLRIGQPPLSRTIKHLERELGVTLFDRTTRSVRLTPAGQALVTPAREVLEAVRRAQTSVRSGSEESGLVRIAFAGLSTHRLVAGLARAVRSRSPGIQLDLFSHTYARPALKKVIDSETDIALGRWRDIPAGLSSQVVMADSLVIALPDTHVLAGARRISLGQLATDTFITLPADYGSVLTEQLVLLAESTGFTPKIVQEAPDTQTALALVGAEVGCHLTLASVAECVSDPHVVLLPIDEVGGSVDMRAAWRADHGDPALSAVLEELFRLSRGAR